MNHYKVARALFALSIFCATMEAVRIAKSGTPGYIFLIWNLVLAWIPYYIAVVIQDVNNKRKGIVFFLLWLMFFPNAPYIITDLLHLRQKGIIPLWFDVFLLISFAWTGLLLGILSLYLMQQKLRTVTTAFNTNLLILSAIVLSGYGVYLGRFLRWNSWDVLLNPVAIFYDTLQMLIHPFQHASAYSISIVAASFIGLSYLSLKLIIESKNNEL